MASGGTAAALGDAGLPVTTVELLTGAPEMLGGRVKTLHPRVHGGLLADLGNPDHRADLERLGVEPFELVVSNLYPFTTQPEIEMIDIGGPAMVRAAAKNHAWVGVVTSPDQYDAVLAELQDRDGPLSDETRRRLAREAFARTAAYDAAIVAWLEDDALLPEHLVFALERTDDALRYGENPHQAAARYRLVGTTSWWDAVRQHSGVALSYLNFYDTDAAWRLVHDLGTRPACAIIKHANPCGVAVADTLADAYTRALACDEQSAFGGVVAVNRPLDAATAEAMVSGPQADVVIAPAYDDGTVDALIGRRRNTRLLEGPPPEPTEPRRPPALRRVPDPGAAPLRRRPRRLAGRHEGRPDRRAVARRRAGLAALRPREVERDRARQGRSGGGDRRRAAKARRLGRRSRRARPPAARPGGACASDAFYPFPDGLEAAAAAGVAVVVQPGGAMRDDELTRRADELGLAMVLTGERHFLH